MYGHSSPLPQLPNAVFCSWHSFSPWLTPSLHVQQIDPSPSSGTPGTPPRQTRARSWRQQERTATLSTAACVTLGRQFRCRRTCQTKWPSHNAGGMWAAAPLSAWDFHTSTAPAHALQGAAWRCHFTVRYSARAARLPPSLSRGVDDKGEIKTYLRKLQRRIGFVNISLLRARCRAIASRAVLSRGTSASVDSGAELVGPGLTRPLWRKCQTLVSGREGSAFAFSGGAVRRCAACEVSDCNPRRPSPTESPCLEAFAKAFAAPGVVPGPCRHLPAGVHVMSSLRTCRPWHGAPWWGFPNKQIPAHFTLLKMPPALFFLPVARFLSKRTAQIVKKVKTYCFLCLVVLHETQTKRCRQTSLRSTVPSLICHSHCPAVPLVPWLACVKA